MAVKWPDYGSCASTLERSEDIVIMVDGIKQIKGVVSVSEPEWKVELKEVTTLGSGVTQREWCSYFPQYFDITIEVYKNADDQSLSFEPGDSINSLIIGGMEFEEPFVIGNSLVYEVGEFVKRKYEIRCTPNL